MIGSRDRFWRAGTVWYAQQQQKNQHSTNKKITNTTKKKSTHKSTKSGEVKNHRSGEISPNPVRSRRIYGFLPHRIWNHHDHHMRCCLRLREGEREPLRVRTEGGRERAVESEDWGGTDWLRAWELGIVRRSSVKGREREREKRWGMERKTKFFLMGMLFKWSGGSGGYPIKIMKIHGPPET